ncbi:hypothetical protein VaNZ11_008655 [Volvox africanus]|uniref:Kinesin light chain n=1 Tax=Volvox africanus TaxID=51714 RepID=A0ABQ5S5L0_9CHLO|nr:hypothetical protein VaNZ11_008655 [Volvox africanus]
MRWLRAQYRKCKTSSWAPTGPATWATILIPPRPLPIVRQVGATEQLFRQNVIGSREVLSPEDPWVMLAINNLASVLKAQGKYCSILGYLRVVSKIGPPMVIFRSGLCRPTQQRYNKYGEAEQLHHHALEDFERVLGPHHPGTLAAVNNLALVLHDQGQYSEAEKLHRRVLESYERRHGSGSPSIYAATATADDNTATATATASAETAIFDNDATAAHDSQGMLRTLNNLALLLQDQGKYGEAEKLHRRVVACLDRLLGPEHPDTLSSVTNLASVMKAVGRYDEAEQLHRRALLGVERVLSSLHSDTLRSANNLANALKEQSKFDDAEVLHAIVASSLEKVLGPDHPDSF